MKQRKGALKAQILERKAQDRREHEANETVRGQLMLERLQRKHTEHLKETKKNIHKNLWIQSSRVLNQKQAHLESKLQKLLAGNLLDILHSNSSSSSSLKPGATIERATNISTILRQSCIEEELNAAFIDLQSIQESNVTALITLEDEANVLEQEISKLEITTNVTTTSSLSENPFANMISEDEETSPVGKLRRSLMEQIEMIDQKRIEEYETIQKQWIEECKKVFGIDSKDPNGSWNADDQIRFECIVNCYSELKKQRQLIVERLIIEFQDNKPVNEIEKHYDWNSRRKFIARNMKAIETSWRLERSSVIEEGIHLLEAAKEEERLKGARVEQHLKSAGRREVLHGKLQEMREERRKAEEEKLEMERKLKEEEEQEEENDRDSLEEREKAANRAIAGARKAEIRERKAIAMANQNEKSAIEKERRLKQVRETKRNVEERQRQFIEQQERRRKEQEAKMNSEIERQNQIIETAISLAPSVSLDPGRVMQPTMSVSMRVGNSGRESDGRRMNSNSSYTAEHVMREARSRVTEALSAAGLLGTDYAQKCILSMAHPRLDSLTSDERANIQQH